ncbi:MAG: type II toxin-antitoxin system RelE/ParE family toxin [Dehalococcoidia bacterium]|nr:type II toxin-antitoxin system RelE/ParE family toxin [Dehalococcoidia bacterium]
MGMYVIEYYTRRNGYQPVIEWLANLSIEHRSVIINKIKKLSDYGLLLLGTEALKAISGDDKDLYEIRGGQCRVATYYDRQRSTFVLLHAWLKKKPKHEQDIEQARHILHEYLATKKR